MALLSVRITLCRGGSMPARCVEIEENLRRCNCTYGECSRRGHCCACLRYHLEARELPACAFSAEIEKTLDRSFKRFIETYG